MKTYTINGKTYTQSPLVIGQVGRLLSELRGVEISSFDPIYMISAFGGRLPRILACVLVPDGQTPDAVDVDSLAAELFSMSPATGLEVLDDFLDSADLESFFSHMTQIIAKIAPAQTPAAGSESSAPSSPAATP